MEKIQERRRLSSSVGTAVAGHRRKDKVLRSSGVFPINSIPSIYIRWFETDLKEFMSAVGDTVAEGRKYGGGDCWLDLKVKGCMEIGIIWGAD
ncbi:hypothetical protein E3N88_27813 [Mikania micrantha]|uniref:Uncharacterized protein n=1 Tax=Mikania micrantha TaxID=192012 RepID=A0A5N6N0Q3_9ASTR|nr:hypothetical protein E3N88_27813 [Mikania micrantha]